MEKVNPALVGRDAGGKVYTVRYDAVNAVLLNEFLKEHRKVEQQEGTIWRGRQSSLDRTLASVRFLWQAQSRRQAVELSKTALQLAPHQSVKLRTHNNSRMSQLAVTLSRVAAFCLLQKFRNFGCQFL